MVVDGSVVPRDGENWGLGTALKPWAESYLGAINIAIQKTPASATDTGTKGDIVHDANYIYVCTATDTWVRAALSTW